MCLHFDFKATIGFTVQVFPTNRILNQWRRRSKGRSVSKLAAMSHFLEDTLPCYEHTFSRHMHGWEILHRCFGGTDPAGVSQLTDRGENNVAVRFEESLYCDN